MSPREPGPRAEVTCRDRGAWRAWLDANRGTAREVWLVFFKKHTGEPCIAYEESVEEALCVGWIDSLVRRIDDDRFARKFTPRTDATKWSASNVRRVEKLIAEGRMTEAGLAKYAPADPAGANPPKGDPSPPAELRKALARDGKARTFFESLPPSQRRRFVLWVDAAKRDATRARRVTESIELLRRGQTLGMK